MSNLEQQIVTILSRHMGSILARSILKLALESTRTNLLCPSESQKRQLAEHLAKGIRLYVRGEVMQSACLSALDGILGLAKVQDNGVAQSESRTVIPIETEADIVTARSAGFELCGKLGFSVAGQVKVATAISELARNIVQYATRGTVMLATLSGSTPGVEVIASDKGPGIPNLDLVLNGRNGSKHTSGIGLKGVHNLMDECRVRTGAATGTVVVARKYRV